MREIRIERNLDPANDLERILLAHPKLSLRTVSSTICQGRQTTVIHFHGDEESLGALRSSYVDDPPSQIEKIQVLRDGKRNLLIYEVERSGVNPTDISIWVDTILGPETIVRIHKSVGSVTWHILTFREDRIPDFLRKLDEVGQNLKRILTRDVSWYQMSGIAQPGAGLDRDADLTPSEELMLKTAVRRGYYEQPKHCQIKDLATELSIPKSTAHHTLKRAERKLLKYRTDWVP